MAKLGNLLVILIAITIMFPLIKGYFVNTTLISSIFMLFWFLISIVIEPKFFLRPTKHRMVTFLFIIYTVVFPYITGNAIIGNRYLNISIIFFFYIVYEFNKYIKQENYNKFIVKMTIPFFFITLMKTILALLENPSISRSIKTADPYTLSILQQGVGGYSFIYFSVFLSCIISYVIIQEGKKINHLKRILLIISDAMIILLIILSNYFIALLMVITGALGPIVIISFQKRKYFRIFIILFLIGYISLYWQQTAIYALSSALEIIKSGDNYIRLNLIKNNLLYGSEANLASDRGELFFTSVKTFLKYPIFGLLVTKIETYKGYLIGVGQHAHIIDTFAFYGFGIGIMQIYIILQPFISRIKNKKFFVLMILFEMLVLFNYDTVTPLFGFALFMIFPLTYDYLNEKTKDKGD